jgi:microcompartment protein CcmK/EutM
MNRTRRLRWPLAATLLALMAGCGETVAPAGTPSTVSIHAYVDADGSGGISEGDVFIPGIQVTLEPTAGGAALQATTNEFGVALFDRVPPGSYRVSASGPVPEGAVLATSSAPVIAAPYQGGQLAAEFRYVFNPGEIVGRVFRDNNDNGVYDPGTDTPAPGIPVALFAGSTTDGEPVATTVTDADGVFRFSVLRPGQYTYRVSPLPTMTIEGGLTQTVTVQAQQVAQAAVRFTGSLISTIAQVRATSAPTSPALGETVAFEGVVTAGVGVFSTSSGGNQFNVQDATGGVLVLDTPLASGIQQGDSVRVIGRVQVSGGEFVIRQPTTTVLASGRPVPAPHVLTAQHAAASTAAEPLQGSLVTVPNVRVDSVGAGNFGYNVFVTGTSGGSFIVRVSMQSIATQSFWQVGRSYNITGTLAHFNAPQVKVRSAADITTGSLFPSILEVRRGPVNDTVTVEGVVTAGVGVFSTSTGSNQFNVQDATAGILVLQVPLSSGIQLGDSVRVTGRTSISGGEFLLTGNPTVTILASGRPVPPPVTVTAQHVAASTAADTLQGRLVRVRTVTIDSVGAGNFGYNVFATGTAGGSFIIRVSMQSIATQADWQVGSAYDIVGTLAAFNVPQIKVRGASDIALAGTLPLTIGEARRVSPGTPVTVTGVVTAGVGVFSTNASSNQFNVQDPTGGILVLQVPLASGIALGDSVVVSGTTQISAGEFLITSSPTVTVVASNRPVPAALTISPEQAATSTAADPLQGSLVRVENIVVTAVSGTAASTAYNVTVRDQSDGNQFIVRVGAAAAGIPQTFWEIGTSYHVRGTLGNFNGAQVKLRQPDDAVVATPAPSVPESDAAAMRNR